MTQKKQKEMVNKIRKILRTATYESLACPYCEHEAFNTLGISSHIMMKHREHYKSKFEQIVGLFEKEFNL